ncbi:2-dehydropantoate 2-reductase, partial [Listeria monocytogenes]
MATRLKVGIIRAGAVGLLSAAALPISSELTLFT